MRALGLFSKRKSESDEQQQALEDALYDRAKDEARKEFIIAKAREDARKEILVEPKKKSGVWGKVQDVGRHIGPGPALVGDQSKKTGGFQFGFATDPDEFMWGKKKKKT